MSRIIALETPLEDAGTGGQATYHVIQAYMCLLMNDSSNVTLAGYISRESYEAGKRPLMHVTAQLNVRPTGDSEAWPDWFYRQILANPSEKNVFADALAVHAAEEPAA